MPLTMHCDDEALESYSLGRLREDAAASLEEHILTCEFCQHRLERVDSFVSAFRVAARGTRRQTAEENRGWLARLRGSLRPMPLAGLLAAAALSVAMLAPHGAASDEPEAAASLSAWRGDGQAEVPAGRRARLELDTRGLAAAAYRAEITDARGRRLWTGTAAIDGLLARVSVPALPSPGAYFVRLYDAESGHLAREFGLRAR